jgi:hypothetical protein
MARSSQGKGGLSTQANRQSHPLSPAAFDKIASAKS